jgi:hypothetical protein
MKQKITALVAVIAGTVAIGVSQVEAGIEVGERSVVVKVYPGPTIPHPWIPIGYDQHRVDASPAQIMLYNTVTGQTVVWEILQHGH